MVITAFTVIANNRACAILQRMTVAQTSSTQSFLLDKSEAFFSSSYCITLIREMESLLTEQTLEFRIGLYGFLTSTVVFLSRVFLRRLSSWVFRSSNQTVIKKVRTSSQRMSGHFGFRNDRKFRFKCHGQTHFLELTVQKFDQSVDPIDHTVTAQFAQNNQFLGKFES